MLPSGQSRYDHQTWVGIHAEDAWHDFIQARKELIPNDPQLKDASFSTLATDFFSGSVIFDCTVVSNKACDTPVRCGNGLTPAGYV